MFNKVKYRFSITIGDSPTVYEVNPRWRGDLNRRFEMDGAATGGQFYRETLTGKFIFQRADFDRIESASIDDEIVFTMEKFVSGSWATFFNGYFTKTDCEFDLNNKTVEVQPIRRDQYEDVLTSVGKEYDFLQLATQIDTIAYKKQPLIQVYFPETNYLTSFLGSTYFESLVTPTSTTDLGDMGFGEGQTNSSVKYYVTGVGNSLSPDVSGVYELVFVDLLPRCQSLNGQYIFDRLDLGGGDFQDVILDQNNSDAVVYRAPINEQGFFVTQGQAIPVINTGRKNFRGAAFFTSETDVNSKCQYIELISYVRLLTDKTTVNGTTTDDYDPDTDLSGFGFGYDKVLPLDIFTHEVTDAQNNDKGRIGRFPDDVANFAGEYYGELIDPNENTFPLARSEWNAVSVWFAYNNDLRDLQQEGSEDFTLKDGYKLGSVIRALLNEFAPNISHEETTEYSEFLYSATNPVSNETQPKLYITPATNIIVGEYDQPAQRSLIRLGDILSMLWNAYQVGWYIEDNKLKFEHISFFQNGGDYSTAQVGEDLTATIEPKTGKNWAYRTNKFKYEKQNLPERIVTKWSNEKGSVPFVGYPIEINSNYIEKGNVKETTIARFYTDLDYVISNPNEINKDDLILIGAVDDGSGGLKIPFVDFSTGLNRQWIMQNGYLSMIYLHDKFFRHNLPAESVTINENEETATTTTRTKIQEIDYPLPSDFDPLKLVTTGLGIGKIKSVVEKLNSETAKITIKHDTN